MISKSDRKLLHVVGGSDVSLNSGGYIVAGYVSSTNLAIDNNEVMVRNGSGNGV